MADEQNVVRNVSWGEVLGFSHIFKSFKMAIQPGKVMLALAAIAITFALGKWVMDPAWSLSKSNVVMPGEAWALWAGAADAADTPRRGGRAAFDALREQWLAQGRVTAMITLLGKYSDIPDAGKLARENFSGAVKILKGRYAKDYDTALDKADETYLLRFNNAKARTEPADREEDLKNAETSKIREKAKALEEYIVARKRLETLCGPGIFGGLMQWEDHCLENALISVRRGNFLSGLTLLMNSRAGAAPPAYRLEATLNQPPLSAAVVPDQVPLGENMGLVGWLALMAWGVWWMISTYPIYSLIYVVIALAVWSLLGGAICRICALHSAREEKISMSAALRFSASKFLSFFFSPLLPTIIIAFLGLALFLGGLVGALPYFGEWFTAILLLLALILGLAMAFLTVGLVGGSPLMWPTIAVEGSDAFDAVSRSYSYVYARPFRYALYLAVAAVYTTACYLFVRLFALVALRATHCCVGLGMNLFHGASREPYGAGAGKLDVLWPQPTFDHFVGSVQTEALADSSEWAAAHLINLWMYLVAGAVIAVLICLVISAATNIYFLLRRQVDATDLDDVYIEEPETAPEAPAAESAAAPAEPAAPKK